MQQELHNESMFETASVKICNGFSRTLMNPILQGLCPPSVHRVAVLSDCDSQLKGLGKCLGAAAVHHAWSLRVMGTTGAMHHTLGIPLIERRMRLRVWDLSTNDGIKLFCGTRPVIGVYDQKYVRMRQTALLNSTVYM